jgi:hypothetical protein
LKEIAMATAQYYVARRRAHGYELVQVRPVAAPGPWWTIGGTVLALIGMRRRTFPGLAAAAAGVAMICRGSGEAAQWHKQVGQDDPATEEASDSAESGSGPSYQNDGGAKSGQVPTDRVEEASMQSFPASDPPSYLEGE